MPPFCTRFLCGTHARTHTQVRDHQAGAVLRDRGDRDVGPVHDRVLAPEQAEEHVEGKLNYEVHGHE